MKILLIDDNPHNNLLMTMVFKDYGTVDSCTEGAEGVEKYLNSLDTEEPYDILFVDIIMQHFDGHQVIKTIRQKEIELDVQKPVKLVALTVLQSENSKETILEEGADAFLSKPLNRQAVKQFMTTMQ